MITVLLTTYARKDGRNTPVDVSQRINQEDVQYFVNACDEMTGWDNVMRSIEVIITPEDGA